MRVQSYKTLPLLSLILFMSNCSVIQTQQSSKEDAFVSLYPNCTMNETIRFLPLQENDKFGNNIILNYKNYSQDQISFSPGSGVRILRYEQSGQQWVEVENTIQYSSSPEPRVIVGPSDEMSSYGTVVISPVELDDVSKEIRVVVTGLIYQNNLETNNCVGGFIDLQP